MDSQTKYAIKIFYKQLLQQRPKAKEEIQLEVKITRQFDHDNIIKIIEIFEGVNSVYLVMELQQGGTLTQIIKNEESQPTLIQKSSIMKKLLETIQHVHQKGYMHRDIKPDNILVKKEEKNKQMILADFGLAMSTKNVIVQDILFKKCGTPGYTAPEILDLNSKDISENKFYNEKVDIYSLGIVFYYLISRQKPFKGENLKDLIKLNKKNKIQYDVLEIQESQQLTNSIQDLIKSMTCTSVDERFDANQCLQHEYFKEIEKLQQQQQDTDIVQPQSNQLRRKSSLLIQPKDLTKIYSNINNSQNALNFGSNSIIESNIQEIGVVQTNNQIKKQNSASSIDQIKLQDKLQIEKTNSSKQNFKIFIKSNKLQKKDQQKLKNNVNKKNFTIMELREGDEEDNMGEDKIVEEKQSNISQAKIDSNINEDIFINKVYYFQNVNKNKNNFGEYKSVV